MPVILKTQQQLNKVSPWSAFAFRHEYDPRPETKIPKQKMPKRPVHGPFISRDTGDMPAQIVEPTRYLPLVYETHADVPSPESVPEPVFKKEVFDLNSIVSMFPTYDPSTGVANVQAGPSTGVAGVQAGPSTGVAGVQTEPYPITQHPEFVDTISGILAFEQQEYEKKLNALEKARAEEKFQREMYGQFVNTFLYGAFKVPISMAEELDMLMNALTRVEGQYIDGKFVLNPQSQYNQDLSNDIQQWLRDAAAAGQQVKNFSMGEITSLIEDYINRKDIPKRGRGGVTKKKKKKEVSFKPGIISETLAAAAQTPPPNRDRNYLNLTINTNVPRRHGPRAPTTATQPQPNTTQITAANIVPGRRRRKNRNQRGR